PGQLPRRFLDRPVPAQGHARAHRSEAEPGLAGDAGYACGAGAALENRRNRGGARAPLAGLPEIVCRERDQIVGGHHQGKRCRVAMTGAAKAASQQLSYSGLILAALTTLAHFSISLAKNLANSA